MAGEFEPPPPRTGKPPQRGEGCLEPALEILDPLSVCCDIFFVFGGCSLLAFALLPQLVALLVLPSRHRQGRVVAAIRLYQCRISTHLPARCRFTPTCSHYAAEAITEHGLFRGGCLAVCRLLRCRPDRGRAQRDSRGAS